ncbi:MAG: adenine phosphoribosyltransferase [Vampirovibrionales bacterium]
MTTLSPNPALVDQLQSAIRDVVDFPKPGIVFKDITPILSSGPLFRQTIQALAQQLQGVSVDAVVGIESRGFLFGAALAYELGVGFVPIRKPGKLPAKTVSRQYALEYGTDCIEMHADAVGPGHQVVVVDDLLATGGTATAAVELLQEAGATIRAVQFVVDLAFLGGRAPLQQVLPPNTPIQALITYS